MIEFTMPSLGADMEDGTLVEWRVKSGDFVKRGDIIADVDTQKGLIEIEVFDQGTIDELIVKEGEKVPVGTIMAIIIPVGEKVSAKKKLMIKKEPIKKMVKEGSIKVDDRLKISPLAKKIAKEKGIDLSTIIGSGPEGSIIKKDIDLAIAKKVESHVEVTGGKKEIAAKGLRTAIASAMSKSNKEIPHFYLETRIDMTKALNWLRESNKERELKDRLLAVALLIKATAKAIKEVPSVNAFWENGLKLKNAINIGFAVSLRKGGVVTPAIREDDKKSLKQLMALLNDLIPRARALQLRSSELSESTITISNIGEGSTDKVFGVIYPPQVAILGFGNIVEEAWAEDGELSARPVVHVTLAADHRAIDGYLGSRFLMALKRNLQKPEAL
ncbi:dihydrolipoamide acetyltransferase family protein [uncultured Eudoraea sp.]|uniref:dihydrolipoamide acetyltransferase family protein n=1 Tax=uncultured Eudoraea sp. TaxID=1035614 RepID=UPI002625257D|nr:dihydrolipoamide acetyltransferase family protein [uncultured Eudoraea sp.]